MQHPSIFDIHDTFTFKMENCTFDLSKSYFEVSIEYIRKYDKFNEWGLNFTIDEYLAIAH